MFNFKFLLASIVLGVSLNPSTVFAQQYNSAVSNPFSFCSAPKPCKQCQPMRKFWEELCPNQKGASKQEAPNPTPAPSPSPVNNNPNMTQDEIRAEIARLMPLWNDSGKLSTAAYDVVLACVEKNGRVQDGFCAAEMAQFNTVRAPTAAYRDEVNRLRAMLK